LVDASGLLPTAVLLQAVRDLSACGCATLAAGAVWSDPARAQELLALTRLLALDVLVGLCPEISAPRLAVCVGLDPFDGPALLRGRRVERGWPAALTAAIVAELGPRGAS
jgi:hypothetical protein